MVAPDFSMKFTHAEREFLVSFAKHSQKADVSAFRKRFFTVDPLAPWQNIRDNLDETDDYCWHLLVMLPPHNQIVGSYRLITPTIASQYGYYAETEFYSDSIKTLNLLEIGRPCIDHAIGVNLVFGAMWLGLSAFIEQNQFRWIWTTASVPAKSLDISSRIYTYAIENDLLLERSDFTIPHNDKIVMGLVDDIDYNREDFPHAFPGLVRCYFNFGGILTGPPAFDKFFGAHDFSFLIDYQSCQQSDKYQELTSSN